MANRYAVPAGGVWTNDATWSTTSGGSPDTVAPTAADNAIINASSGAVTIDAGAVCRSIDCLGYTNTLTHTAAVTLSIGDATAGTSNIALRFSTTMTYTRGSTTTSVLSFVSTSGTQQTITSGGKTFASITINGRGSSYLLTQATLASGTLTSTLGVFSTGNFNCTFGKIVNTSASVNGLSFGTSTITLNSTGSVMSSVPALVNNTTAVDAGGYDAILTSAANWGGGTTERHFLNTNHKSRIRQNGTITQISFFLKSKSVNLTAYFFEVWRKNGSTYDRLSQEDILASLVTDSVNTVTLSTPVAVLEGDYIGYGWTCLAAPGSIMTTNTGFAAGSTYFVTDAAPLSTNYDWEAQTASTSLAPFKVYMEAPDIVMIGDSITAGHSVNYSFCEATDTTAITSAMPSNLGTLFSATYQNMGVGGQTSTNINSRFTADCVNLLPRYAVINCGINDLISGLTEANYITRYTTILDSCATNGIHAIVMSITPWTNGTTLQMQTRDSFNTALQALVATYPTAIYVDMGSTLGMFRAGGDAGNLWDIQAAFDQDGIHLNATGYQAMANKLYTAIRASYFSGAYTLLISDTGASSKTFAGGGLTYNDIKINGSGAGAVIITGANTFNRIYTDGGGTKSITLPGSTTTTLLSGQGLGNGTNVITFTASAGSATVYKASGTVGWDYVNMTNIIGDITNGTKYYAGPLTHSTDGTGNTNWIFEQAPKIGGSGTQKSIALGIMI